MKRAVIRTSSRKTACLTENRKKLLLLSATPCLQERDCGDNDIVSCDMMSPYCLNVGRLACASPCSSSALSPLGWVGRKAPGWEGGPPKDSIKGIRPPHSTMPGMQKRKKRKPRLKAGSVFGDGLRRRRVVSKETNVPKLKNFLSIGRISIITLDMVLHYVVYT